MCFEQELKTDIKKKKIKSPTSQATSACFPNLLKDLAFSYDIDILPALFQS